jgi:signal transduction histidine kinase
VTALRPGILVITVAVSGAIGTLAVGLVVGMPGDELAHLGLMLVPAVGATVGAAVLARPLLLRAPIRHRLIATAVMASALSLVNLTVLGLKMFVNRQDAILVEVLILYSVGAGIGVALVQATATARAINKLLTSARSLAEGDLSLRTGHLDAAPELDVLAHALDSMAEQLARSISLARDADEKRRDLITAVSHDLRTPLAGLRAMVEAIDERVVEDPPSLRRYASEMRRAVGSLVLLVDDLFELAQLDVGGIELDATRIPLHSVVRSVLAACTMQASTKGLALEANIDDAADTLCSPRLARVLQNLVQNAIRHTPSDGSVLILAHRGSAELEIEVVDSGEGIPAENLDRVFEPFWRGDASRSAGGSGLGLALAKRIVETLGGTLQAESHPGIGSRFAVVMPYGAG